MRIILSIVHWVVETITSTYRHIIKGVRDIALTLYDDMDFKVASLPRFLCLASFIAIMASWVLEQGFNMPYSRADILLETFKTAMIGYVAKKVDSCVKSWKGCKTNDPPESN